MRVFPLLLLLTGIGTELALVLNTAMRNDKMVYLKPGGKIKFKYS
jgi:hypothetical protein